MTKSDQTRKPAKGRKSACSPAKPAPKKRKPPEDDDIYEQGDMATPERDPPYEDGI